MEFTAAIALLEESYRLGLPGMDAQMHMAPDGRKSARQLDPGMISAAQRAAVIALLLPLTDGRDTGLLLMERSGGLGVHAGQVSFPGGKQEGGEELLQTALREAWEETGVRGETISMIGPLSPLYIPPSDFYVQPFLGYVDHMPDFQVSEDEVKRLLIPPLPDLLNMENIRRGTFNSSSGAAVNAPYFSVGNIRIWGATAMMISELVILCKRRLDK